MQQNVSTKNTIIRTIRYSEIIRITNASRRIRNAWRFWFDSAFVFTAQ